MKKIIDLQTFQKITTDCMRVHETFRSTEPLTAEAERILQLADSLLREAGLAYLREGQNPDVPNLPNSEQATPLEQVVENFIGVQHALVDLKQELCQLVKTQVAEQRWPEVTITFNALISLGENGSEPSNSLKVAIETAVESTLIPQAEDLFRLKEWEKGRTLLRSWLSGVKWATGSTLLRSLVFSPKFRSCYYTSYIDQSYALNNRGRVGELNSQLPQVWGERREPSSPLGYLLYGRVESVAENNLSEIRNELNEFVMHHNFRPRTEPEDPNIPWDK